MKGLSGCFSNSFLIRSSFCCRRSVLSSAMAAKRCSSNTAKAALKRRSGWRSTRCAAGSLVDIDKASSALSIPVAFRVAADADDGSSSSDRSRPRLAAPPVFAFADFPPLGLEGCAASSSFSAASRSAFRLAASADLAAAASLDSASAQRTHPSESAEGWPECVVRVRGYTLWRFPWTLAPTMPLARLLPPCPSPLASVPRFLPCEHSPPLSLYSRFWVPCVC